MSNYEAAPATTLLATNCAVCGRALVDAHSVETGMGPECRKRHGYEPGRFDVTEATRSEVNRRVWLIALWRSHEGRQLALGQQVPTKAEVVEHVAAIKLAGFTKLAGVLSTRLASVVIEQVGDVYSVDTPFSFEFIADARRLAGRWDSNKKAWTVHVTRRNELHAVLRRHYGGSIALGPKGLFVLQAPERAAA